MTSVMATMRVWEGTDAQAAADKKITGAGPETWGIVAALVLGGTIVGYYAWFPNPPLGGLIGGFAGVALQYPAYRRAAWRAYRKRLKKRYVDVELPLRVECSDDVLIYEYGDVRQTIKWSCVSELFWNSGYWIFVAQESGYLIPQAAFAGIEAEREFVGDALSHMSAASKARSRSIRTIGLFMTQRIAHLTFLVRDCDEAIAWFAGKLGFALVEDTDFGNGNR